MSTTRRAGALLLATCLLVLGLVGGTAATASPARAATGTVTNLAHLDFLLDTVRPAALPGHSTYRLAEDPDLRVPWTYADVDAGAAGGFRRIGGGSYDAATDTWSQGAFNTDDIARAAVVYLRHWRQTGSDSSRDKAYDLLREVAYLQTTTGENRGRSVLWMQPDGTLNPSAEPVELPDPSDSGPSYWQARTLWAYGEGYAAFRSTDPAFARFLADRLRLSVRALDRDVLDEYGHYDVADGRRVPAWLIVDGSDASAEAVLGLAAYAGAAPGDHLASGALVKLARGIAAMATSPKGWPYGAVLPWTQSRSDWHAWSSQQSAALARAATVLRRKDLLRPAVTETVRFDPTLLTSDGADNGWLPTPVETVQIAYGVDSRVQSLLAVADAGGTALGRDLAGLEAAWFFGANRADQPMYDPSTGVTFDGLEADGRINPNSGAESTIHGLLTMLALDAHPAVRAQATRRTHVVSRAGLRVVEAESAAATTGSVVTPESAWTGESSWSGGAYLQLDPGERASLDLGDSPSPVVIEPVSWQAERGAARSAWSQGGRALGTLRHRVGTQGVTAASGALLPQRLTRTVRPDRGPLEVVARHGQVRLDALLVRPAVSRATFRGSGSTTLVQSASSHRESTTVAPTAEAAWLGVYDARGRLVENRVIRGPVIVRLPAGGVAVVVDR